MKKLLLILVVVCIVHVAQAQENLTLKVKIEGIKKGKGELRVSLFNSEETYLKKPYQQLVLDLEKIDASEVNFNEIVSGTYAITIIQDENKNGELDIGFMGPEEGLGYSNNVSSMFGPAPYEEAKFKIDSNQEMLIKLK